MQRAFRIEGSQCGGDRILPSRDHRDSVGDHDAVEAAHTEILRAESRGVGDDQGRLLCAAGQICARGLQHLGGDIEAVELGRRIMAAGQDQIAAGATTDFQNACSICSVQARDRPIPAEEVIFPRQVIDVPLVAIHPVHMGGVAFRRCTGAHWPAFT
ncbi:hypothetical protein D3C71_1770820 [compost metagenome]